MGEIGDYKLKTSGDYRLRDLRGGDYIGRGRIVLHPEEGRWGKG